MVSMEATSGYWRIWFAVLEEAGLAAAGELLPGREPAGSAEDRQGGRAVDRAADRDGDAAALVRAAAEIRALRACTRHIWDLTADRAR
jgi:hypothetical protein